MDGGKGAWHSALLHAGVGWWWVLCALIVFEGAHEACCTRMCAWVRPHVVSGLAYACVTPTTTLLPFRDTHTNSKSEARRASGGERGREREREWEGEGEREREGVCD